jgi:hypothetical protein
MTTPDGHEFELPRLPEPERMAVDDGWPEAPEPSAPVADDAPAEPTPEWTSIPETRRVVLRVHGAEEIELGRAEGREPAVRLAREMIGAIEEAQARGEWPLVEDRFIRPGAIVSIDVQRAA